MIQNDATFNEQQFYIVDAKTGKNRGNICIDPYDAPREDVYNNMVRGCIKAGGAIREARELLGRSLEQMFLIGYDCGYTSDEIHTLVDDIKKFLEETA